MRIVQPCLSAILLVVISSSAYAQSDAPSDVDARISKLVGSISESRMEQLLRTLFDHVLSLLGIG